MTLRTSRKTVQPATFQPLEARRLFAAGPDVVFSTLNEGVSADFHHEKASARRLEMSPMMRSLVNGSLSDGGDVDMIRLVLKKGHIFTADLDSTPGTLAQQDFSMELLDRRGNRVMKSDQAIDPVSGLMSEDPSLVLRVQKSGTYYLRIATGLSTDQAQGYVVETRSIGTRYLEIDDSYLATEGRTYVTLRGETLSIIGPTGEGFELVGNWTRELSGDGVNKHALYTADGAVTLRSPLVEIPLTVSPFAKMEVKTRSHVWSNWYGELDRAQFTQGLDLHDIVAPFTKGFGLSMDGLRLPEDGWGIRMGNDPLLESINLPLNPAVPYIFYTRRAGIQLKLGDIEANAGIGANFVFDPTDALFVSAENIPVVGDVAFGVSQGGRIPYNPSVTLPGAGEKIFGHVYVKGGFDISAVNPTVPASINGDVVFDLDANDDGRNLNGWKTDIGALATRGLTEDSLADAALGVLGDIAYGVNGEVRLGYGKGLFNASVRVGEGSLAFNGTEGTQRLRGTAFSPFEGTSLAAVANSGGRFEIDSVVSANSGAFYIVAKGNVRMGPTNINGFVRLDNNGIRASGRQSVLGSSVLLNGSIFTSGAVDLSGRANVNLGVMSGNASFRLAGSPTGLRFTASLSGGFDWTVDAGVFGRVGARGNLSASLTFHASGSGFSYSAGGSGNLAFDPLFDVGAGIFISNRQLALNFKILGANVPVRFALP